MKNTFALLSTLLSLASAAPTPNYGPPPGPYRPPPTQYNPNYQNGPQYNPISWNYRPPPPPPPPRNNFYNNRPQNYGQPQWNQPQGNRNQAGFNGAPPQGYNSGNRQQGGGYSQGGYNSGGYNSGGGGYNPGKPQQGGGYNSGSRNQGGGYVGGSSGGGSQGGSSQGGSQGGGPQGGNQGGGPQGGNQGGGPQGGNQGGGGKMYYLKVTTNSAGIKAYDGYYIKRRNDNSFGGNYNNRVSFVKDKKDADVFTLEADQPQRVKTRDGWWIKFDPVSQGSTGSTVSFSNQKTDNPIIVGTNLAATYNRFAGYSLCTSQYGAYMTFSVGTQSTQDQAPTPGSPWTCGQVSAQLEAV